jgi:hypothetical protein
VPVTEDACFEHSVLAKETLFVSDPNAAKRTCRRCVIDAAIAIAIW